MAPAGRTLEWPPLVAGRALVDMACGWRGSAEVEVPWGRGSGVDLLGPVVAGPVVWGGGGKVSVPLRCASWRAAYVL